MVDLEKPPVQKPDPATRRAAMWATAIALPVAVLVGLLIVWRVLPAGDTKPAAGPPAGGPVAAPPAAVQRAAPKLTERPAQVCLAVTSQLPTAVRNLPARKVSTGPEQTAAYGEPPITVACGVPQPTLCER